MKMWPETNNPKIKPPEQKPTPGRPPRNRRRGKDEPRKKYGKMSKQGVKKTCSKCHQQGYNRRFCKRVPDEAPQAHGQSSQGSTEPNPRSSRQTTPRRGPSKAAPISSSQPSPPSSSHVASSKIVCGDASRVRRVNEPTRSAFCGDTSIPITQGIKVNYLLEEKKMLDRREEDTQV